MIALVEVAGLDLVLWRVLAQVCSLGGCSLVPALVKVAPVEVVGLSLFLGLGLA